MLIDIPNSIRVKYLKSENFDFWNNHNYLHKTKTDWTVKDIKLCKDPFLSKKI